MGVEVSLLISMYGLGLCRGSVFGVEDETGLVLRGGDLQNSVFMVECSVG